MIVRARGRSGPAVVLVHGGPGAPGEMGPLARALEDRFRVLEPFQREDGDAPITVARHVEDLREVVASLGSDARPAVVGHSWGAMLALAFGAAHPDAASRIALIGCGTFDPGSRARFREEIARRGGPDLPRRTAEADAIENADARLRARAAALEPLYFVDPISTDTGLDHVSERAHRESWEDMLRLQAEGVYPAAFATIVRPVLMLHGADDPHPGPAI
ncbi:MAG TPA: alpha/beta hydrolase, partial [Planctomycetota bacterium]|nr:alpha/beta hydrolase [Planctomycetota bacterium]